MKESINAAITAALCCVIVFSCKKQDLAPISDITMTESKKESNEVILGNKLENPYAVSNMEEAYKILSANSRVAASPVKVTHYYIRFLPKDWKEYDILKADRNLKLYDYPLDYEILSQGGRKYHDPSIPADLPTWQYTAIAKSLKFNTSIKHEILQQLYIPELDQSLTSTNNRMGAGAGRSFLDQLVNEAMIITKNYSDTIAKTSSEEKILWDPSGFVRVYDTRLARLIPLKGVKMRARRWFDIREVYTNADGYYQIRGFKNDANYALYFEQNDYDVRTGTFGQAWLNGPKSSSPWNVDLYGIDQFYAHVFRGAYRYYYEDIYGLRRPQDWSFGKMKFAAHDKDGEALGVNLGNWSVFGANPNILVYRYKYAGIEMASDELFSTTVHEICHSTHFTTMNAGAIQFAQVSEQIIESWARGIQWFLVQKEYTSLGISNYASETYFISANAPIDRGYQNWVKPVSSIYTSLFIDLVDNFNQRTWSSQYPNDNVTSFTFAGIESGFLKHVYGLGSLRNELKNNKPSRVVTDKQIDVSSTFKCNAFEKKIALDFMAPWGHKI